MHAAIRLTVPSTFSALDAGEGQLHAPAVLPTAGLDASEKRKTSYFTPAGSRAMIPVV